MFTFFQTPHLGEDADSAWKQKGLVLESEGANAEWMRCHREGLSPQGLATHSAHGISKFTVSALAIQSLIQLRQLY